MSYLKYLASATLLFVVCSVLYTGLALAQLGSVTSSSSIVHEVYSAKSQVEAEFNTPKLTVLSGSNSWFGVSCEQINAQLSVECFNGGTNAIVSVDYMLDYARDWLKPGDTALLALEYHNYEYDDVPRRRYVDYLIARDPERFWSARLSRKLRILWAMPLSRLQEGIKIALVPAAQASEEKLSTLRDYPINRFGDRTDNTEAAVTPEFKQKLAKINTLSLKSWTFSKPSERYITSFLDWAEKNDVRVLATWPNIMKFDNFDGELEQAFVQDIAQFYQQAQIDVLGQPESFMYDKDFFYDSRYHPHAGGRQHRTQQLIELLRPYFQTEAQAAAQ